MVRNLTLAAACFLSLYHSIGVVSADTADETVYANDEIWGAPLLLLILVVFGFGTAFIGACIAGYMEHRNEINPKVGRLWREIVRMALGALNGLWLYPFGAYIYCTDRIGHRGKKNPRRH